jgi:N-acetylmuramic acid 6-phosphate etherase
MLRTEMRNEKSMHIDKMETIDMLKVMNEENMNSVLAVEKALPQVAKAVDAISTAFENGGKLIYIGAGTSGRLGIIDAAECPPTYGVPHELVQGIIAGGKERVFRAGENEEDNYEKGVNDVKDILNKNDILVGISAAGGAKYILAALETAKNIGCTTICITSNEGTPITKAVDIPIVCDTGAEVVTGSTRLKAGNAQKFVLNMLSTCAMIKTGKVYENLMINLKPSNEKLRLRVIRITSQILSIDEELAIPLLEKNDWDIRKTVESVK